VLFIGNDWAEAPHDIQIDTDRAAAARPLTTVGCLSGPLRDTAGLPRRPMHLFLDVASELDGDTAEDDRPPGVEPCRPPHRPGVRVGRRPHPHRGITPRVQRHAGGDDVPCTRARGA
jgi:hypothetical protein